MPIMAPLWILLLVLAAVAPPPARSSLAYCPFNNSTDCQCEDYEGGHDLWCPTRYNHDYRINYKGGVVWITCNPEKPINDVDLIRRAAGIQLPTMHSLKLEHCPVFAREAIQCTFCFMLGRLKSQVAEYMKQI